MERNDILPAMKKYNKTLSALKLTNLEKWFVEKIEEKSYFYGFPSASIKLPENVEVFLKEQHGFQGLLKEHGEKLCLYLRHMQEYTCNSEIIRMDVRSSDFSRYSGKVFRAIGAFYLFYGMELSMKELVYGVYRELCYGVSFAPVIAAELLAKKEEVVQYCRDVLISENNTAVLTRDVIVAIEQSHNRELQQMLTQVLLAAKLQEGLRQSVLETVDENNREYFLEMTEVIESENLLRFSSVQRAVLTWIGIGYEEVAEKDLRYIFACIRKYFTEEAARRAAYETSENPLDIYLALYCLGTKDVEAAIAEAIRLLDDSRRYVVASALIYLKLTRSFEIGRYLYFTRKYADDDGILALFYSECSRNKETLKALTREEAYELYGAIEAFMPGVGAQKTWASRGFSWFRVTLTKDILADCLYALIDVYPEMELVDRYLPYAGALHYKKLEHFMEDRFGYASETARKEFMLKEIISSNEPLVAYIEKEYRKMSSLTEKDLIALEGRLKTKKAKSRASIVRILAAQGEAYVRDCYDRLLASPVKTIQESAMELRSLKPEYFEKTERTPILGREEGFGLYTPNQVCSLQYKNYLKIEKKGLLRKTEVLDVSFLLPWNKQKVLDYFKRWNERITLHENEEYYNGYAYCQVKNPGFFPLDHKKRSLDAMPLCETWRKYFEEDGLAREEILEIYFLLATIHDNIYWEKTLTIKSDLFTLSKEDVKEFAYIWHFEKIFTRYFYEAEDKKPYTKEAAAFLQMTALYSRNKTYDKKQYEKTVYCAMTANRSVYAMQQVLHLERMDDETFREYFPVILHLYHNYNVRLPREVQEKYTIEPILLARALSLEIIPRELVFEAILDTHMELPVRSPARSYSYYGRRPGRLFEAYRDAYYEGRGTWGRPHLAIEDYTHPSYSCKREVYECLRGVLDDLADAFLVMETGRLNDKTPVTDYVEQMVVIRGIGHLIQALRVLRGENIRRQTHGNDRDVVFSNVIRHCYPNPGDDAGLLLAEGFGEERLVETAMLAPQWIDVINEILGWKGFKDACYYFTAHMKQYDYVQKKAEIAKYTDIEPEDLNDGAFDMQWCRDVYENLGEKRFQIVYKAAKFLCENSFHTRARKYADACLGKVAKEEWRIQAEEKRNKDALNAYCICPIESDADLLERYLYVQKFIKESKQYGSQRQASEKRAAEMALLNLARNSRFETVTRLSWMMESEMVSQNAWALSPQTIIEGLEMWIAIDDQGACELLVRKKGKLQKSVPAEAKKKEAYLKLKEIRDKWKEQYRRSRKMLEQAMEDRTEFSPEELRVIMTNPIVAPMMQKLVLLCGTKHGFYEDGQLCSADGVRTEPDSPVRIAHSYDLYHLGCWQQYQQKIFALGMVQPFKQVFRELYLVMEEEKDLPRSERYSDYQIQTKKAASVLKGRKWNVSYENGLERIYYKENLVVNLFAEADWFSPSDIEAPSIDYVAFYSRKDGKPVLIRDVDPIVFSEVMRDIDLVVSTAYVGGVDPVTSFSTIELRKTIVEYTCRLMKLDNVTVREHFADIKGKLNDYSVHLGSGMIHQSGGGAIHVIAVHSQKRGKVYLPFLDEDPRTAEIISKVVMFAEDRKIKDPEILRQIHTR